jgi:hypothetical protein
MLTRHVFCNSRLRRRKSSRHWAQSFLDSLSPLSNTGANCTRPSYTQNEMLLTAVLKCSFKILSVTKLPTLAHPARRPPQLAVFYTSRQEEWPTAHTVQRPPHRCLMDARSKHEISVLKIDGDASNWHRCTGSRFPPDGASLYWCS